MGKNVISIGIKPYKVEIIRSSMYDSETLFDDSSSICWWNPDPALRILIHDSSRNIVLTLRWCRWTESHCGREPFLHKRSTSITFLFLWEQTFPDNRSLSNLPQCPMRRLREWIQGLFQGLSRRSQIRLCLCIILVTILIDFVPTGTE